jgi:hypothetical protein
MIKSANSQAAMGGVEPQRASNSRKIYACTLTDNAPTGWSAVRGSEILGSHRKINCLSGSKPCWRMEAEDAVIGHGILHWWRSRQTKTRALAVADVAIAIINVSLNDGLPDRSGNRETLARDPGVTMMFMTSDPIGSLMRFRARLPTVRYRSGTCRVFGCLRLQ